MRNRRAAGRTRRNNGAPGMLTPAVLLHAGCRLEASNLVSRLFAFPAARNAAVCKIRNRHGSGRSVVMIVTATDRVGSVA